MPQKSRSNAASASGQGSVRSLLRNALCGTAGLVVFSASLLAQGHGGGGMRGGGGGGFDRPSISAPPPAPSGNRSAESTMRGGLQLGPPGRWWDDNRFAKSIGLESQQQQRMDAVFSANKGTLITLYKNLQHEESQLEKTVHAKELNEAEIFQQIDRVTQARGELEKANAHMLLQLRKEMTAEQASRLEDHRGAQ
jgi:Spy/CpxP family protein refolding chaperone